MAGAFNGASSHISNSSPPITTYPFTVGIWVYQSDTNSGRTYFGLANNGALNNYFYLGSASGPSFQLWAQSGGTSQGANVTTLTSSTWNFVLGRFISATNRRISVVNANGAAGHAQGTTNITPSGVNSLSIGRTPNSTPQFFHNGRLAEFWWADADIQGDNAQTQDSLLRQLAFGGPFSVPDVVNSIIEYHSLRSSLGSESDLGGESYYGKYGKQNWTRANTPLAAHCPLPYWYAKPPSIKRSIRPALSEALIGIASAPAIRRRRLIVV